jgi:anti-anti-sigma factor
MMQCRREDHATVIKVAAEKLDMDNVAQLRQTVEVLLAAHTTSVIIDLQAVQWIGSLAIGFFFYLQNASKEYGGKMILTHMSDQVQKMLLATHTLEIFTHYSSTAEALEAIGQIR